MPVGLIEGRRAAARRHLQPNTCDVTATADAMAPLHARTREASATGARVPEAIAHRGDGSGSSGLRRTLPDGRDVTRCGLCLGTIPRFSPRRKERGGGWRRLSFSLRPHFLELCDVDFPIFAFASLPVLRMLWGLTPLLTSPVPATTRMLDRCCDNFIDHHGTPRIHSAAPPSPSPHISSAEFSYRRSTVLPLSTTRPSPPTHHPSNPPTIPSHFFPLLRP